MSLFSRKPTRDEILCSRYEQEIAYLKEQLSESKKHIVDLEDRLMAFAKQAMETYQQHKGATEMKFPQYVNEKGEVVTMTPEEVKQEEKKYHDAAMQILGH